MKNQINKPITTETKLKKALLMFSYGKFSPQQAAQIASKAAPIFEHESQKNSVFAHKGINWYAKEIIAIM